MLITRYEILEFGKYRYWAGMLNGLADIIGEIEYTKRYDDFYKQFNEELPRPSSTAKIEGCTSSPRQGSLNLRSLFRIWWRQSTATTPKDGM